MNRSELPTPSVRAQSVTTVVTYKVKHMLPSGGNLFNLPCAAGEAISCLKGITAGEYLQHFGPT